MRAGTEFGEDHLLALDEELYPEQAVTTQFIDHFARHVLGFRDSRIAHRRGLPALLVIPALLPVADRRAEAHTVLVPDGQESDLVVEVDELLDDDAAAVAAHIGAGVIPGRLEPVVVTDRALALAGRGHHWLDDTGKARVLCRCAHLVEVLRIAVFRGHETEIVRREVADCIAVHGKLRRLGGRHDVETLFLKFGKDRSANGLDFRNDVVRPVPFGRVSQLFAIEHREDLARIGQLHCGGIVIGIAGHDIGAEALGGDDEFAAQFSGAEKEDLCGMAHFTVTCCGALPHRASANCGAVGNGRRAR